MKVVFLCPSLVSGTFYGLLVAIMQAAAGRLGIELEVLDCEKRRERFVELGKGIAARRARPDCVLLPNYKGAGQEVLGALDAADVDAFVFIEAMTPTDRLTFGEPRTKHKHWLGELHPDDAGAGQQLAALLADAAHARGLRAPDGKIHVGILSGDQTPAGQLRFQGWLACRKDRPELVQAGVQYASWMEQPARTGTALMLRSHPEISVIWAANDDMAIGAVDGAREAGRTAGKDLLIGGVDVVRGALERLADGRLAVTLGGHVLDGARALLLLHDRRNGHDFAPHIRHSRFEPVTAAQATPYLRFLEQERWNEVPFERYSRAFTGGAEAPELSFAALVEGASVR